MKNSKENIIVLIIYVIISIILTYPVAFSDKIIGDGTDTYWYMWDLWHFKTSLLNFDNPYYTQYIYYPIGINLTFSAVTPFNAVLSIPLQLIFDLNITYKILWLMSFFISGYGAYLLTKYLTNDVRASFISGLIFSFSPYHFSHAIGHLNLATIEWIPFYILFLFKTVQEKKIINVVYTSFFLFLVAMSDYYYLMFISFFTLIFICYILIQGNIGDADIQKRDIIKRLCMMIIIFGLIFSPFAYSMIKELISTEYMYDDGFVGYSADLLAFFIPTQFHPVFKDYVSPIYKNFTGNLAEYHVFIGYTVLFLAILAILKIKTKIVKFWTLCAIIFFIFSLGPILHINGIFSIPVEEYTTYIPLPYLLITKIPIISIARALSRWDVLLVMSVAVLAGFGLSYINNIQNSENKNNKKNIIFMILSGLIIFEFLAIPYPVTNTNIPKFYYELANDSENYAILEIPDYADHVTLSMFMYYQTVHKKRLINGYTSRTPRSSIEFKLITPLIRDLHLTMIDSKIPELRNDITNINITDIGPSILNYYNVQYIIVHKNYLKKEQVEYVDNILTNELRYESKIYNESEDDLIVYRVEKVPLKSFMIIRDNGDWYDLEQDSENNFSQQWMANNASIFVYSVSRDSNLYIKTKSFYKPRPLYIYSNDELIHRQIINTSVEDINIKLKEGKNMIKFYSPDGCQRPIDILESKDIRCLSMEFENISII